MREPRTAPPPEAAPVAYEPEPEFDIHQWLEPLRRRRRLLATVTIVVLSVAAILWVITPRQYRAVTLLQVERRAPSVISVESLFGIDPDMQSFYPTQQQLLKSRGLAERVVKDLRLTDDPTFNPERGGFLSAFTGGSKPVPKVADDARALAKLAQRLQGSLTVTQRRNTRLIELAYVAPTGELAAKVVNGVSSAYIDWGIETRQKTAGSATTFLASQIVSIKKEIQDKEAQLQAYSLRTDIVNLDPGTNDTLQRLEALNKEYTVTVADRINKEARHKELESTPSDSVVDQLSPGVLSAMRAEQYRLEKEYALARGKFKAAWPGLRDMEDQIRQGRENLARVSAEVLVKARESARAEYQAALRREETMQAELTRQKSEAMKLNSASVEYNNLKVEVSTRRTLLNDLLKKQSETEVAGQMQDTRESNVIVVDRAMEPEGSYRPSLKRNLGIGLLLGLLLGVGCVFLLEHLDRTLKSPDDVDRILGLPTLAVIPDVSTDGGHRYGYYGYGYGYGYGHRKTRPGKKGKKGDEVPARPPAGDKGGNGDLHIELLPFLKPRLAASEAYRSLRTALLLSSASGLKTIVVTSAVPGEGKTATAVNIAVVLAQLGKRVLLVDADLRKPRLHELFKVSNRTGLVTYLTGTADPEALFLATDVAGLSVVPSGPTPPNPSELLASDRMRQIVALARGAFDHVVFDTPPVLPVTDAAIVGGLSDGVTLCVGAGIVQREDAETCIDRLALGDVKILGVALNRFRASRSRYGSGYHRYDAYSSYGKADGDVPEDPPSA